MKLNVSSYIAELLYENDCVVLPDFGGFVASYKPSSIGFGDGTVNPPSKSISFNKSLTLNDGLLINHIVKKEGLSYEETKKKVEKFAKKCNRALAENEPVVFAGVGKVSYDIENNIKFEADTENYLSDAYGLPTIKNETDTTAEIVEEAASTKEDKPQTLNERLAAQQAEEKTVEQPKAVPIDEVPAIERTRKEDIVVAKTEVENQSAVKPAATTTSATKVAKQAYTGTTTKVKEESAGILKWLPALASLLLIGILGLLGWGFIQNMNNPGIAVEQEETTELAVADDDDSDEEEYIAGGTDDSAVDDEELDKEIEDAGKDEINDEDDAGRNMTEKEFTEKINRVKNTFKEDITGGNSSSKGSSSTKSTSSTKTYSSSSNSKGYTVVIGAFSSRSNAEARKAALEADGLETEIGSLGRLHRVGVNIVCEPSEIQGRLREIQAKYNKKAWILKK